ncbi:cyclodeaminase/cyclohydrolase family protein [Ferrimicrobium acidiphilum]|jgi:formiminotetrahydrofolate cyclodeaminase|uniref:Formiminotransferase-cyclodeaminase n=1 Tax=Ferrimicrobium acidiphilum DSM 19497 TaxID=1121877 RepID=A0A0D8FTS9_9ACTN|nr:cyclodeaminase/cyclohydrolase family protein [Ferrimicrobium acidiphilum]KJE76685.1 formiminotransferase-cyclodeaminase [Ferrimicrobium acidiphilum DSM 19497]
MNRVKLSDSAELPHYLSYSTEDFIEMVAEPQPAPAAGSVAALTVSLAAALCVKSALLSTRQMPEAPSLANSAKELMHRSEELCQVDAQSYAEVILALRAQRLTESLSNRNKVQEAIGRAAQVLLEVVKVALEIGSIASQLAEQGNPNLIGDSITAAVLAEAGVRSSIALATINLKDIESNTDTTEFTRLLAMAEAHTTRAQEAARARSAL